MSKELKLKKQVNDISKTVEHPAYAVPWSIFKIEYMLGFAAVFVGLGALYYQKKSYEGSKPSHKVSEDSKPSPKASGSKFNDF